LKNSIIISFALVCANLIFAHFTGFLGLILAVAIIPIAATIIIFSELKLKPFVMISVLFALISFHDIGIRLFSGGDHDALGQALVNLSFVGSVVPTGLILLSNFAVDKQVNWTRKLGAFLLFTLLIVFHFFVFKNLGWEFQRPID